MSENIEHKAFWDKHPCEERIEIKIESRTLDKLGFTEYHDSSGDWGRRKLRFNSGDTLVIRDVDEKALDDDGYGPNGQYQPQNYQFCDWTAEPRLEGNFSLDITFLSDLQYIIKTYYPNSLEEFKDKCKILKMDWGLK